MAAAPRQGGMLHGTTARSYRCPAPRQSVAPVLDGARRCQKLARCYDADMKNDKKKADAPKQEQSLIDYWVSLGMKKVTGTGRAFVIGTGGPVAKKDAEAK
jgi:hypothetical protein